MRVKVAIDLALDRLFDYEVPEALRKKLAVGQLLSVPFGHREARGFAMSLVSEDADTVEYRLKPVTAIIDETPFFSAELLTLVRRLAEYTASPLELVLKAALPAAVMKRNARPLSRLFVEPTIPAVTAGLTERQQWLFDQIVRLGGGWLHSLAKELATTPATLRALAAKGVVKVAPREKRRSPLKSGRILPSRPLPLNEEQAAALAAVLSDDPRPVLLEGVTGSGKTEVYLQAIASVLERGGGAIVMVPEIALTPQTVNRFASRFGDRVAVLHSALSDGERYDEWHRIRSGAARVVVGPRSAVFAPVRDLKLIVVDEEHEECYKQGETPRYHARDAAVWRGAIESARVVLGSATPSLESFLNASRGKYALVRIRRRAGAGKLPVVRLVEMGPGGDGSENGAIFSVPLIEAIRLRLDRGEQVILFLNRRGYSRSVVCTKCGHVLACPHCSSADEPLAYTYHRADRCLRCHVCGGWELLPGACPKCGSSALEYRGVGTQRAEAALAKCFPKAGIIRMDADSTSRRHTHDELLSAFRRGEADILLGTQMIAKGLDFPNVTLVGVLNADASLFIPDFRASERTYQLLSQVAGRSGRSELPGEVLVQTHDPTHPVLRAVVCGDFDAFAAAELAERERANFPPYCHLAVIELASKRSATVSAWAEMYARSLGACANKLNKTMGHGGFLVSSAYPSAVEMANGEHRFQIVLRAKTASILGRAWRWIYQLRPPPKNLKMSIDIDAHDLV